MFRQLSLEEFRTICGLWYWNVVERDYSVWFVFFLSKALIVFHKLLFAEVKSTFWRCSGSQNGRVYVYHSHPIGYNPIGQGPPTSALSFYRCMFGTENRYVVGAAFVIIATIKMRVNLVDLHLGSFPQ